MKRFTQKTDDGKNVLKANVLAIHQKGAAEFRSGEFITITGKAVDKMASLEDAEEDGRLLILPRPLGSPVWKICSGFETTIKTIIHEGKEYKREVPHYYVHETRMNLLDVENWGKAVFASREAAETALEEMRED